MTHRKCFYSNGRWAATESEGFFGFKKGLFDYTGFLLSASLTAQMHSVLLAWQDIILSLMGVTAILKAKWSAAGWLFTVLVMPGAWVGQSEASLAMNRTDDWKLLLGVCLTMQGTGLCWQGLWESQKQIACTRSKPNRCVFCWFLETKKESTTVERKWKSSSFSEGRNMYSRVRTNNVPNINGNTEV